MPAPETTVRLEIQGPHARVILARPPLNILDLATLTQLKEALAPLSREDGLRVVSIEGEGERAFCAGVAIEDHRPATIGPMLEHFHGALRHLLALEAVSVAVVHGHCLGGGMELAACCDLVVAAENSRFGQPEIQLGCFPPMAAALFPRRFGRARSADLLLSGRILSCREAEELGLVSRRVATEALGSEAQALIDHLLAQSGAALRLTKQALHAGVSLPFREALAECERIYLEELASTADIAEGVEAFLAKRPPNWRHG